MIHIANEFQSLFRQINFTPGMIFSDPQIKPWRTLPDRENCTWDLTGANGSVVRLHVKRYNAPGSVHAAAAEAAGYQSLQSAGIPTAMIVAWGSMDHNKSFIATMDLAGFTPADKLVEQGVPFQRLLSGTAAMTAKLHNANLHHRDLYLCHFLARCEAADNDAHVDLRLIDAARVKPLPGRLTRRRWIVKDLSQFWFSTFALPISDAQREQWLKEYAQATGSSAIDALRRAIIRKSDVIAAHDKKLRRRQPNRNVSIPNEAK
jgi:hypothetical protein